MNNSHQELMTNKQWIYSLCERLIWESIAIQDSHRDGVGSGDHREEGENEVISLCMDTASTLYNRNKEMHIYQEDLSGQEFFRKY